MDHYSISFDTRDDLGAVSVTGDRLLASASRDRLIHVFDVDEGYAFQQTLDDHSSSITAVRFTQAQNELKMFSCSADKSIIFRTAHYVSFGCWFHRVEDRFTVHKELA